MNVPHAKIKRRQGGVTTSDLVPSASRLPEAEAFPAVLRLHAPAGLPVVYVGRRAHELLKHVVTARPPGHADTDGLLAGGRLPAGDGTLGAIVLDTPAGGSPLQLYGAAGEEALRALSRGGVLIARCRDEVADGRLVLKHVEVINALSGAGLYAKDIHVTPETHAGEPERPQRVAHVNHSFWLVFMKKR